MLNPSQAIAVEHLSGPLLIIAGAGAGKTHTLTERIARMIEQWVMPDTILAVTFTNKSAKEMRARIGKKLGIDMTVLNPYRSSGVPLVGTFHSIGIFFLRNFIEHIGHAKNFVIYDEDDKIKTIKSIIKSMNLDEKEVNARQVIGAISNAKNQGITAGKYSTIVDNYFKSLVRDIYLAYDKVLTQNNALDFDDILLKTHDLLLIPEVLSRLQSKYKYFMVDEYQDTNDIQYNIVRLLSSAERHLCVVGDDWQGIYGWRGANIRNILSFQKDYPGAMVVKLEQNYRSTKTIIAGANAVIKCNTEALDKTLWTDNEEGGKITLIEANDEKREAEAIVKTIKDSGNDYAKWAILYRTNSQSRLIEESLIRSNIPYKIYWGVKFYERKEIKDILAYLRLIFNSSDFVSFRRIINVPSRKIGDKSVEVFTEHMLGYSAPFTEIIVGVEEIEDLTPQARRGFASFGAMYGEMTVYMKDHSVKETMEQVIKRIGYEEYLTNEYTEEEAETKKENLKEFANMASRYDGMESNEALALFLEEIALITDADRDGEGERETVSLMTIHLAKGLEFENVVIAGAEEGLFPHSRTLLEPKEIEEERRLMYVAMTRAKKLLYITRARERYNFWNYSANPASRFLKEIPEDLLVKQETEFRNPFSTGKWYSGYNIPDHPIGEPKISVKRSITSNDPSTFSLGNRVRHAQFGIGTIVSMSGPIGEIAFGAGNGIKKMHLGIAPIEKI